MKYYTSLISLIVPSLSVLKTITTEFEHFLQNSALPPEVCGGKTKTTGLLHFGHVTDIVVFIINVAVFIINKIKTMIKKLNIF